MTFGIFVEVLKVIAVFFACSLFWILIKFMREVIVLLKALIEVILERR